MTTLTFYNYCWVALGGALGACARMAVGHWVRTWAGGPFPWHTFVVNVGGSFLLGMTATVIALRASPFSAILNHLIAIGFIGAFTTFSAFELEMSNLAAQGRGWIGLLYAISSVIAGYAALKAGIVVARWW